MAWTQADLDKLNASMAKGARVVQKADRRLEMYGVDELRKLQQDMEQDINEAANAATPRPKMYRSRTGRGL